MEAHAADHGHMPVANQSAKVNREWLGMVLFITSELMLFGSFFAAYFFIRVVQGDRIVTGEEAVFYEDQQKVVMTGNAVMLDGANVVRGQKIIVFLNEKRGVVEADANKRVTATIYPNDRKDAPGKKDRRK